MGRFANNFKTAILLGLIMGLAIFVGQLLFADWRMGLAFGVLFGGFSNLIAYFYSDKIALATMGARQVTEADAPELVKIVRELAANAGLPMPRVYVAPHAAPNAFATGRNPQNAVVCATQGLLQTMSPRELRGVIGHELAHVRNYDILITTIAATMASAITSLTYFAMFFGGGRNSDRNPLVLILGLLLAPFAAMLIQLWISRTREFQADAVGATIAHDPQGLANALRRLHSANKQIPMDVNPSREGMFIVSPLTAASMARLFATHPPVEERIRRLEEMAQRGY